MAQRVVLATGNAGKVRELSALLDDLPVEIVQQSELGVDDADETGTTFIENAIIKARHAAAVTGLPAIADDSGLEVAALGGQPGVYSSRYAGPDAADADNVDKLLRALDGVEPSRRDAAFRCVVVMMRHAEDPAPMIAMGRWPGQIALTRAGDGGFGYDPVFFVPAEGATAAELDSAIKNRISHRAQALAALRPQLVQWCDANA